ncbi:MAG: cytochrome c [Myxococcales bacterium]|nr:cytochrome c [Myxococcales bacterium]
MRLATNTGILLASLASLLGCGGTPSGGADDAARLAQYEGPIQSTDAARGAQIFEEACSACHNSDGGEVISNIGWPVAKVRMQIREGDSKMPPIRETRLSDEDLEHLLAHLVTTGTVSDPTAGATAGDAAEEGVGAEGAESTATP